MAAALCHLPKRAVVERNLGVVAVLRHLQPVSGQPLAGAGGRGRLRLVRLLEQAPVLGTLGVLIRALGLGASLVVHRTVLEGCTVRGVVWEIKLMVQGPAGATWCAWRARRRCYREVHRCGAGAVGDDGVRACFAEVVVVVVSEWCPLHAVTCC